MELKTEATVTSACFHAYSVLSEREWSPVARDVLKHEANIVRIINIDIAKLTKLVNLRLVSFLGIEMGRVNANAKIHAQLIFPVELLSRK